MRRSIAVLFLFGTLACFASEPGFQTCTVIAVYDGDTVTARCEGAERRIRLSSVDAPEAAQRYGSEARRFTAALTLNREVGVELHEYDKYGRAVARLVLPDGGDLGRELVRAGLAWHYVKYSRDPELATVEAAARQAREGLWRDAIPEPPSAWRKANHAKKATRSRRSAPRSARRCHVCGRSTG